MKNDEDALVKGLMLLLTARIDECESHCLEYLKEDKYSPSIRIRSSFGYALIAFIRALISFEESDKQIALERLSNVQKLVSTTISANSSSSGWFFRNDSSSKTNQQVTEQQNLEYELIGADAGVFIAIIQFTLESAMGVMKGAYYLRKSYKIYHRAGVKDELDDDDLKEAETGGGEKRDFLNNILTRSTSTSVTEYDKELYYDCSPDAENVLGGLTLDGYGPLVSRECTVEERILASSRLGRGLFNLIFSLIPPRFLTVVGTALGFEASADRKKGLNLLRACVNQKTSRSPIAALSLLSFHSAMLMIARGVSEDSDANEAQYVLDCSLRQYPTSPLFRYFEARLYRSKGMLNLALNSFSAVQKCAAGNTAILHLSTYERAWCCGLSGRPKEAANLFATVARESHWSPAFYSYLAACYFFEYSYTIYCLQSDDHHLFNSALTGDNQKGDAKNVLHRALSLFRLVPTAVKIRNKKSGSGIPLEIYSAMKAKEITGFVTKLLNLSADSPVEITKCNDETIKQILLGTFWPSFEVAYFWNALFQLENKEKRRRELESSKALFERSTILSSVQKKTFTYQYLLLQGSLFREEKKYAEANRLFHELCPRIDFISENPDDKWLIEFGKYERGLCFLEEGNKKKALEWFNAIKDSGHPFDPRLKFRTKSAIKRAQSKT